MFVQFNAIIPLDAWEWENEKSSIFMRFGVKELGDWKVDIGPAVLVRYVISLEYYFTFN